MFLEQERFRVMQEASRIGIEEEQIDRLLSEGRVLDYSRESIKHKLGIKDPKPERPARKGKPPI